MFHKGELGIERNGGSAMCEVRRMRVSRRVSLELLQRASKAAAAAGRRLRGQRKRLCTKSQLTSRHGRATSFSWPASARQNPLIPPKWPDQLFLALPEGCNPCDSFCFDQSGFPTGYDRSGAGGGSNTVHEIGWQYAFKKRCTNGALHKWFL